MFKTILSPKKGIAILAFALLGMGITIPVYANLSNSVKSARNKTYSLRTQTKLSPSTYKKKSSKTGLNKSKNRIRIYTKQRSNRSLLSSSIRVSDAFGVNIGFPYTPPAGELEMMAASGIRWVRIDMIWSYIEQKKGQYSVDAYNSYDQMFDLFAKHNLRPLVVFGSHGQTNYPNKSATYPNPPDTSEAQQAYKDWVVATIQRYKGRGFLWELYNEPNNAAYWPANADVQGYSQMALMVGKAVKQATPNEMILGGSLLFTDTNYLEETFKNGVLPYWDAISLHPYRHWGSPETVNPEYTKVQSIIQKYNSTGTKVPIISSEWGYPSISWNGTSYNEDQQARYLARQWLINLVNNVPVSIWYQWKNGSSSDAWDTMGFVKSKYYPGRNPVYDARKTYVAAKTLTTTLKDYAFSKRVKVGSSTDYVLEFDNVVQGGNSKAYAIWRDSSTPARLNLPITSGKFNVISLLGKNLGTVSAGAQGTSIQLSNSPSYIIPAP
jgi:polysaccharide biosynthesis protein PslG